MPMQRHRCLHKSSSHSLPISTQDHTSAVTYFCNLLSELAGPTGIECCHSDSVPGPECRPLPTFGIPIHMQMASSCYMLSRTFSVNLSADTQLLINQLRTPYMHHSNSSVLPISADIHQNSILELLHFQQPSTVTTDTQQALYESSNSASPCLIQFL